MKLSAILSAALIAFLAASLMGCGSKSSNQEKISRTQLELMPLPASELGSAATGLRPDTDSGVKTNSDAAKDASGNASATTLKKLGRITGYRLTYSDPALRALSTGRGLLVVQTTIELYRDVGSATNGFAFWSKDESIIPPEFVSGGNSASSRPFDTNRIGDATSAYVVVMKLKGKRPVYGTDVVFRFGRLVAMVTTGGGDEKTARSLAVSLAKKMQARIRQVLAGKIS